MCTYIQTDTFIYTHKYVEYLLKVVYLVYSVNYDDVIADRDKTGTAMIGMLCIEKRKLSYFWWYFN